MADGSGSQGVAGAPATGGGRAAPVDPTATLRLDRDRYVAFAFAAADLLLELDTDGRIGRATGAARSMVGRSLDQLAGIDPADLAVATDRALVRRMLRRIVESGRVDPAIVRMEHPSGSPSSVMFCGCGVPSLPGRSFLSLRIMPERPADDSMARDTISGLLTKDGLIEVANRAMKSTADGRPKQLTLVQLNGLSGAVSQLAPDRASLLMEEIGASLRALSAGGDAAARLGEEQFGLVAGQADQAATEAALITDIADAAKLFGIQPGVIGPQVSTVELSGNDLTPEDAAKSIAYAVNRFCKTKGTGFEIGSLKDGLTAAFGETMARVADLRRIIEDGQFVLNYQPIVDLGSRLVHHYEVLTRFQDGRNPYDTITFGEEVGLVHEFDYTVCARAIEVLEQNATLSLAVNMSGSSVQNDQFRQRLSQLVGGRRDLKTRLLFELTESAQIDQIDAAVSFLRWLRKVGYSVCLDDFGAGAAAYGYLRQFDVDYVKIDGPFLRAAVNGTREKALIRSIATLCRELGSSVVGEMIEDEAMAAMSRSLGIEYGQGYLYGKPSPTVPAPTAARAVRRKGVSESWQ